MPFFYCVLFSFVLPPSFSYFLLLVDLGPKEEMTPCQFGCNPPWRCKTDLDKFIDWVVVFSIGLKFSVDVQVLMWLPSISWADIHNTVHQFVVFSWFLQVELVAWEGNEGESLGLIFLD